VKYPIPPRKDMPQMLVATGALQATQQHGLSAWLRQEGIKVVGEGSLTKGEHRRGQGVVPRYQKFSVHRVRKEEG
jgi:hypothetical protein